MSKSKKEVLVIGTNEAQAKEFGTKITNRIITFQELVKICEKHELKYTKEALYADPSTEIDNAVDRTFCGGVLKQLSTRKRKELFEIDTTMISKLVTIFNQDKDLDFSLEDYSYNTPSFDVVIEGKDRILDYKKVQSLIALMEEVCPELIPMRAQQALKNRVLVDMRTNKLVVNKSLLNG